MTKKTPSNFDRLLERASRYPSESRLSLVRNLSYGAAAVCMVILVETLEVGVKSDALEVALIGAAVGIPLWIAVGTMYELYLNLGKQSYPHIRTMPAQVIIAFVMLPACFAILSCVGAVLWHLSMFAFVAFSAVVIVAFAATLIFAYQMANWWFSKDGPNADNPNCAEVTGSRSDGGRS